MKNQTEQIIERMEKETPNKIWYSLNDMFTYLHKNWDFALLITDADYIQWGRNYLADILKNSTIKPKNPKVFRKKINHVYHYRLSYKR